MDQLTPKSNMSMLQLMHEMQDRMTSFDNMLMKKSHLALYQPPYLLNPPKTKKPTNPSRHHWCIFCDKGHNPFTCELYLSYQE